MLESVWLCVYVSVSIWEDGWILWPRESRRNLIYARNKNRIQRQTEWKGWGLRVWVRQDRKVTSLLFQVAYRHLLVCVYFLLCALCPSPLHAPKAAQWSRDLSADSGGAGTAWDKWAALFHFLHPFAFDVLWLISLLLTLSWSIYQTSLFSSARLFLSL